MKKGRWEYDSSDDEVDRAENGSSSSKYRRTAEQKDNRSIGQLDSLPIKTNNNVEPAKSPIQDLANVAEIGEKGSKSPSNSPLRTTEKVIESEIAIRSTKHKALLHGCRSVDEYQRLNYIAEGTYGAVFRARCRASGDIVAIKQVKLGAEAKKSGFPITALREINILLALTHPYILPVREMVVGSSTDKIFMVADFFENDLRSCLKKFKQPFSIAELKLLLTQLLSAIEYMHEKWYIHRDLKSTNILYSNKGYLTVCDFGLARKYGHPIIPYTNEVVTLYYRCPELLLGSKTYSTPLDMWSVGCIFGEMLCGEYLFPGQGELDQIAKIFRALGAPTEEKWPGFSSLPNVSKVSWKAPTRGKLREMFPSTSFSGGVFLNDAGFDLLSNLLHMDPEQRLSASAALRHPWLTSEAPRPAAQDIMPTFTSTSAPPPPPAPAIITKQPNGNEDVTRDQAPSPAST